MIIHDKKQQAPLQAFQTGPGNNINSIGPLICKGRYSCEHQ